MGKWYKRHRSLVLAGLLNSVAVPVLAQTVDEEPLDLGTLVLRGTKIGQTAEDAPPSITVIDGADASATANRDIDDILQNEANVLANEGLIPPSIRGVGGLGGDRPAITAGAQPRVPVLIDDVALPSGEASNIAQTSTWDLDSVEVARGPQATSTGRNTLGGAIRVYTNDPVFDEEGALRLRFTDQAQAGLDFMANTQLIENQLAFRLTGEFTGGDSYITNPSPLPSGLDPNEERLARLRAKLLWQPLEIPELSVLFTAERSRVEGPTEGFFNGNIDDLSVTGLFGLSSAYEIVDQTILSTRVEYAFSDNTTMVARVSHIANDLLFADTGESLGPGFDFGETGFDKKATEAEVYVAFEDVGAIKQGVVGLIHTVEDEVGFNRGGVLAFDLTGKIENTALFGEAEFAADGIAPGLSFVLGGRFERDDRTRTSFDGGGALVGTGASSEDVFLPKAGLRYEFGNSLVGYTYSEGFRGGGLDVDLGAPFSGAAYSAVAFGPEFVDQHEIFFKTTALDGALDFGATAFFYKWKDAQVSGAAAYPASGDLAIGNVPEAEGYGLELDAAYRFAPGWSLSGSLGLLETEITDAGTTLASAQGQELPLSPNTTASLTLAYENGNGFDASATVRYVGSQQAALNQVALDSYTVVDIAAGFERQLGNGRNMRIDAFVENLFDERYETFNEPNAFGGLRQVGQPRTIGVSLTYTF